MERAECEHSVDLKKSGSSPVRAGNEHKSARVNKSQEHKLVSHVNSIDYLVPTVR
jgi:hypothetical protein